MPAGPRRHQQWPLTEPHVMSERRALRAGAMGPPLRRVLLLGEGNFSFAAALCGARGTHVVATCYESEEEAAGRGGAARSIRRLRDSGGCAPGSAGTAGDGPGMGTERWLLLSHSLAPSWHPEWHRCHRVVAQSGIAGALLSPGVASLPRGSPLPCPLGAPRHSRRLKRGTGMVQLAK